MIAMRRSANRVLIQFGAELRLIGRLTRLRVVSQRKIEGMREKVAVRFPQGIVPIAQPTIVRGVIEHRSSDWIELDGTLTDEQIAIGIDQRGLVTTVAQGTCPPVGHVDVLNTSPAKSNDEPLDRFCTFRCDQSVHVAGHENIGMRRAPLSCQRPA